MELLIDEEREEQLVEVPETLSTIGDKNVFMTVACYIAFSSNFGAVLHIFSHAGSS